MKKMYIILIFIAIATNIIAQTPVNIKSKITDVFVYLTGAQISRTSNVSLQKGENIINFTDITNQINEESIRIETDESLTILAVILRPPEELSEIEKDQFEKFSREKAKIQTKINRVKKTLHVYKIEEDVLLSNKIISGNEKGVVIDELKQAADFFRIRLIDIYDKKFVLNQQIVELRKEIYKISKEEFELRKNISERKSRVEVKVVSSAPTSKKFTLRYFVHEAGWLPVYDIRLKDIDKPLIITAKAKVVQNTDEDWTKVNLLLSTGNPANSIVKPELSNYYLNFNNQPKEITAYKPVDKRSQVNGNIVSGYVVDSKGLPMPGVTVMSNIGNAGTITDLDGRYEFEFPIGTRSVTFSFIGYSSTTLPIHELNNRTIQMEVSIQGLDEIVVLGYGSIKSPSFKNKRKEKKVKHKLVKEYIPVNITQKIIDMEYNIDVPYTIPSDGESYVVEMVDYEVPAKFEYSCVPKYSNDAYLSANIINWAQYNILSGEANVYFENKYVGKSLINTNIVGDTMQLSIGVDKSIAIERNSIKDFTKRKSLGTTIKVAKGWEISIKNNKSKAIVINVEDQFPISKNSTIEIEHIEKSNAEHNESTGKLTWKVNLEPNANEKIKVKYEVKYPKKNVLYVD